MISLTSDIPRAGRVGLPAKITSAMAAPRRARGPCSPSTHAMASTMLDLPDPLGPTITLTPGVNSRVVLSANDLKPRAVRDRRNTSGPDASRWVGSNLDFGPRVVGTSPRDHELLVAGGALLPGFDPVDLRPVRPRLAPL